MDKINKRNTFQKQLVLQTVLLLADHPTADEVYEKISSTHPNVARGTVYRNLNCLADDGQLRKILVPHGADRFDHNVGKSHYHILCAECGSFEDVDLPYVDEMDRSASTLTGFEVTAHDIVFTGRCPRCRAKNADAMS